MQKAEVVVASPEQKRNVQLVAKYASVENQINVSEGKELSLKSADGRLHLSGLNTICRCIADLSSKKEQLLGIDCATRAQVSEWLSYRNTALSPVTEDKLHLISAHLLTRTFLLGNTLTLPDLCLFASLHKALVNLPASQVDRFSSLFRWGDHVQNTTGATAFFPLLAFQRSALPELPVPALPRAIEQSKHKDVPRAAPMAASTLPAAPKASKSVPSGVQPTAAAAASPGAAPAAVTKATAQAEAAVKGGKTADVEPDAKKAKKEARKEALKQAEAAKKAEEEVRIDMLDIRVGQITEISDHPNADALYVEQIDFGDGQPRQVVSGLRKFIPKDQMTGRKVVVCTNLKPAKMRDVMSYGMVLCASTKGHDKVDPLKPPGGAPLGERITISGYSNAPLEEINPKKKIVEKLKEDLRTDSIGVAIYKNIPFMCSSGPVTSSVPGALVG